MDIPNPREELERKVVESLDDLAYRLHAKQITRTTFGQSAHLLWRTTAGLVDASISELCEAASGMADEAPMRQCLVNANQVVEFSWFPSRDGFTLKAFKHGFTVPFKTQESSTPIEERPARLASAFEALQKQGYFLT